MVRFLGVGGMSSGPRNGRFRIDRSRKGLGGGLGPAEPLNKKDRYCSGGAIGSATAAGSIVTSHRFLGQVLLSIFAFSGRLVILLLPHPHAAQCPTCSGASNATTKCSQAKHTSSRSRCIASLAGTSNTLLAIAWIKVTARLNRAGGVASLIFALYSAVSLSTYSSCVSPSSFSRAPFGRNCCAVDDCGALSRTTFAACVFSLGSLMSGKV